MQLPPSCLLEKLIIKTKTRAALLPLLRPRAVLSHSHPKPHALETGVVEEGLEGSGGADLLALPLLRQHQWRHLHGPQQHVGQNLLALQPHDHDHEQGCRLEEIEHRHPTTLGWWGWWRSRRWRWWADFADAFTVNTDWRRGSSWLSQHASRLSATPNPDVRGIGRKCLNVWGISGGSAANAPPPSPLIPLPLTSAIRDMLAIRHDISMILATNRLQATFVSSACWYRCVWHITLLKT